MLSQCAWQSNCSSACGGREGGLLAVTLVEVLCCGQKQPCRWEWWSGWSLDMLIQLE